MPAQTSPPTANQLIGALEQVAPASMTYASGTIIGHALVAYGRTRTRVIVYRTPDGRLAWTTRSIYDRVPTIGERI